jgi:hypothetical protein
MLLLANWLFGGPDYMLEKLGVDQSVSLKLCIPELQAVWDRHDLAAGALDLNPR